MKFLPVQGMYIHVPFCIKKCNYCSFYSVERANLSLKDKYITRLLQEISERKKRYPNSFSNLSTLYFGGGTPSELPLKSVEKVLKEIDKIKPISELEEITFELNPVSRGKIDFKTLRSLGINRLSIGIQTLNDDLLRTIGRSHNSKEALQTLEEATKAGFDNISVDIMYGLPSQTIKDIEETLESILGFPSVKHISAYSLTLEDGTPLSQQVEKNQITLPDEELERDMDHFIKDYLKEKGFKQYEISNYALPGYKSKHNSLYWNLDGYQGFGPGASSFVDGSRFSYPDNLLAYLNNRAFLYPDLYDLDDEELKGDFMFLGLRQTEGVSDSRYKDLFGSSFFEDFKDEIDSLIERGLIEKEEDRILLTPLGQDLGNQVFLEFV